MSLAIGSNVIVVAVWLAFLVSTPTVAVITQIAAFSYLLAIDQRLLLARLISVEYFRMRFRVTLIVVASLAVIAFSL
jgi:hypothetical protein